MPPASETVETLQWSDRELMLRIYTLAVETNGTVRQHDQEIYGRPEHGVVGLRQIANENSAYLERVKTLIRLAGLVAGALLSILTALLVMVAEHVL